MFTLSYRIGYVVEILTKYKETSYEVANNFIFQKSGNWILQRLEVDHNLFHRVDGVILYMKELQSEPYSKSFWNGCPDTFCDIYITISTFISVLSILSVPSCQTTNSCSCMTK